tara:strand:+ start:302 stop:694 length:393 start_codon:yes stop_codon:yes gene_type:complete
MNKHILRHILKSTPKRYTFWNTYLRSKILVICLAGLLLICLSSCSTKPIVDSRGKSSANIEGDMNRYHDDLYTCEALVKDETSFLVEAGKIVYNSLRWRVLWLSPKLQTRQDYINNCLEGRGYNVVNKNK